MRIIGAALALVAGCASPRSELPPRERPDAASPVDAGTEQASPPPGQDAAGVAPAGKDTATADVGDAKAPASDGAAPSAVDGASSPADVPSEAAAPITCRPDQFKCNEASLCEPKFWGFENGAAGWNLLAYRARIGFDRFRSGAASLAFEVFSGQYSSASYHFCGRTENQLSANPGIDVRGTTLVAWVNLQVTEGKAAPTTCMVGGGWGGTLFKSPSVVMTPDRWTALRAPISATDGTGSNAWGIFVECWYEAGPPWKGLVHVDDVAFEP